MTLMEPKGSLSQLLTTRLPCLLKISLLYAGVHIMTTLPHVLIGLYLAYACMAHHWVFVYLFVFYNRLLTQLYCHQLCGQTIRRWLIVRKMHEIGNQGSISQILIFTNLNGELQKI